MTSFLWDGVRAIQIGQIESVESYELETMTDPDKYGERPEVQTVEARIVHTISGRSYISEGSVTEVVDLLMS